MTEITTYKSASLSERQAYATTLAHAGDLIPKGLWSPTTRPDGTLGPPAPSAGKILLVMETGAMLGLNPMAALQGIDVIEGKATISPQLMTALVRTAGHTIEIVNSGSIVGGDFSVTVTLTRADDGTVYSSTWDPHRAVRAGLCAYSRKSDGTWAVIAQGQKGGAKPWQSYPETMCKWRAVGDVCREGADDVLKGIAYTREEIEADVSISQPPDPEQTEDWAALIDAAATAEELREIQARLKEKGEGTDPLRTQWAAKLGVLEREAAADPVDAEEVTDDEPGSDSTGGSDGTVPTVDAGASGAADQGS